MKIDKRKLIKRLVIVILLLSLAGYFFANTMAKKYGFSGIKAFTQNYFKNKELSNNITPETLQLNIEQADYEFLKQKREEALERGIQINIGNNYVPCNLVIDGEKIKGEIRLKGHMTDHLQGEKWSFRVKVENEYKEMYRFSLQHPGTRSYANEWLYHELLAEEGIINLRYDFIRLKLNEKELGIYAVEEHFGQHVLERNNKPNGAILRWNPELYWEGRIDEYQRKYLDQEYGHYYSSFAEPYDKGKVLKNENLKQNYIDGATQLEHFRRGKLLASEAFDIEKMASFHAIIDLIGGYHSLDWSDVKFYFNPKSKLIEPVGYESFSIRKTERIAGQQTPEKFNGIESDYHARLFADPIFFKTYIEALERIASEKYLTKFQEKVKPKLDEKLGVLGHEFAYINFSWQPYFENIELIRHNLSLPKALHPFLKAYNDSTIVLSIGAVSDFPIEVIGLSVNGKRKFKPNKKTIIPSKERNNFVQYTAVEFSNNGKKVKDLKLIVRIPGSSKSFKITVAEYEPFKMSSPPTHDTLIYEEIDEKTASNYNMHINKPVKIPFDSSIVLCGIDTLFFGPLGAIDVFGELKIIGSNDRPTVVIQKQKGEATLSKSSSIVINNGTLILENISIVNQERNFIEGYTSEIKIHQSEFYNCSTAIRVSVCNLNISSTNFSNIDAFCYAEKSIILMANVYGARSDTFLKAIGSNVTAKNINCSKIRNPLNLNNASDFRAYNSQFKQSEILARLNNSSKTQLYGCNFENIELGFSLDDQSEFSQPSEYLLYQSISEDIKKIEADD